MSQAAISLPEPNWAGRKFDFYSSTLPFLVKIYTPSPENPSSPNFSDLHKKILYFQAKPDRSGSFVLPTSSDPGSLHVPSIAEPMGDEPLSVAITQTVEHGAVDFSAKESISEHSDFVGTVKYGFEGLADVEDDSCFGITGFGILKLRKVWDDGDGKRLYEGFFAVECEYGSLLQRKGHGRGEKFQGTFWAVEALGQAK